MNSFGRRFRLSLFGESHGAGVGVVVDGVPPGLALDNAVLQRDLDMRRPGQSPLVSQRDEPDVPEILSGVFAGRTTGAPVCVFIANRDADARPYRESGNLPRPGHADFPNMVWSSGYNDPNGGGHASGRLTAPLVAAGTIADLILQPHQIRCAAHLHQVHDLVGPRYAMAVTEILQRVPQSMVFTAHADLENTMVEHIMDARRAGDSLGGVVEFMADGMPTGLGDPLFDSIESQLAHLLFSIPAVKGVEFGSGFAAAAMRGSEHNDPFVVAGGRVAASSNHAGGILGGRTSGMPITGHVAIKPTSSLPGRDQQTVNLDTMQPATLRTTGRHDPCIAVRAVPVVQASLRIVLADFVLQARQEGILPAAQGPARKAGVRPGA